jgi:hypothetical protein
MEPIIKRGRKGVKKPTVRDRRLRNQQNFLPKSYILTIATEKSPLTASPRKPQNSRPQQAIYARQMMKHRPIQISWPLYHPHYMIYPLTQRKNAACLAGGASNFFSGGGAGGSKTWFTSGRLSNTPLLYSPNNDAIREPAASGEGRRASA